MESLFTNNNLNLNDYKSLYSPIYEMIKDKHQEDIKRAGKSILSSEILNKFNEFNNVLKSINIYLVEVGELERFVPSKIGKSGKWLTEVIKDIDTLKKNDDLSLVEKFLRNIMR